MSEGVIVIVYIASMVIWIAASREAVKSSKEINRRKMLTLLSAGSLLTLVLTISLFESLTF